MQPPTGNDDRFVSDSCFAHLDMVAKNIEAEVGRFECTDRSASELNVALQTLHNSCQGSVDSIKKRASTISHNNQNNELANRADQVSQRIKTIGRELLEKAEKDGTVNAQNRRYFEDHIQNFQSNKRLSP